MRIVDLSLPITNDMPGVAISVARKLEVDGWNASTLELYSHCGTHMDAPCHFLPGGNTIDQQDLSACVGEALVLDFSPVGPSHLHSVDDVQSKAPQIGEGSRLLFRTDWHLRYGTPEYRSQLPRISLELAEWLVKRKVAMIGVEGPSVADVNNMEELTQVHQTLFRGNVLIVEGLANLNQLAQDTIEFTALPLHMPGIDGSPVRAIAIER